MYSYKVVGVKRVYAFNKLFRWCITVDSGISLPHYRKEISELAGYTARVADMLNVFEDMQLQRYERGIYIFDADLYFNYSFWSIWSLSIIVETSTIEPLFAKPNGSIIDSDEIVVENLSIISPNGDVLVKGLSFKAPFGRHILISG